MNGLNLGLNSLVLNVFPSVIVPLSLFVSIFSCTTNTVLSFFQEPNDINNRRRAALRGLPVYLREDDSVFFKMWNVGFIHHFNIIYLLMLMKLSCFSD